MSREENIEIFRDTEKLCKTNPVLLKAWKDSSSKQKLILENEEISVEKNIYEQPAKIIVSKKRTFEAAMEYADKKVAVLNFASASNPGGGVVNGSSAQEECLCRCSTLYYNLTEEDMWKKFYLPHRHAANPIHNDDLIYTPDVVIFKSDTAYPTLMPEKKWKKVNVITCAAQGKEIDQTPSCFFRFLICFGIFRIKPVLAEQYGLRQSHDTIFISGHEEISSPFFIYSRQVSFLRRCIEIVR